MFDVCTRVMHGNVDHTIDTSDLGKSVSHAKKQMSARSQKRERRKRKRSMTSRDRKRRTAMTIRLGKGNVSAENRARWNWLGNQAWTSRGTCYDLGYEAR